MRQIKSKCLNCNHTNIEKIRIQPTDYDPDFYYVEEVIYDDESGDYSDSSSGSSDSGTSFSGGSTSGGGSSSSW